MKTEYKIEIVIIKDGFLCLIVDGKEYHFQISKISDTLSKANENELSIYEITPSGYGIHWPLIDEDLSIPGLLRNLESK